MAMFGRHRGKHAARKTDAHRQEEASPQVAPGAAEVAPAPAARPAPAAPPVDLDVPVSNPVLLHALQEATRTGSFDAGTVQAVREGVYLLATQVSGPGIVDGVLQEGTQIGILSAQDERDREAIAAFTDWDALRAAVGEDPSWSAMVETGDSVLAMARSADYTGGLVINPASPDSAFALTPDRIAELF